MNRGRPSEYATGEKDDGRDREVDPSRIAAQRARLPRGMKEVGVTDPKRDDDPARGRRLYFEVNATLLGGLIGNNPDLWMDEYHAYVLAKRAGEVKTNTEYARKFPTGQVKEPSGRFDK